MNEQLFKEIVQRFNYVFEDQFTNFVMDRAIIKIGKEKFNVFKDEKNLLLEIARRLGLSDIVKDNLTK